MRFGMNQSMLEKVSSRLQASAVHVPETPSKPGHARRCRWEDTLLVSFPRHHLWRQLLSAMHLTQALVGYDRYRCLRRGQRAGQRLSVLRPRGVNRDGRPIHSKSQGLLNHNNFSTLSHVSSRIAGGPAVHQCWTVGVASSQCHLLSPTATVDRRHPYSRHWRNRRW
jgi:hypothetical protein